ncbi:NACHT and WD40 repeat domain-containing protein, partial [Mycoavidus cysteinexigens]
MLPISGSNVPPISNASTRSNLLTQVEAIHEQASGEGQSVVQVSESCVVSNQLYGESHTVTTNFFLTDSNSNTRLIFERLNAHAETTRYKPLAQLGTQIEELRTAYLNVLEEVDEIRDGLALYIPSEGQERADSKIAFTLIDKVREFLSSSKKVLLLLGEAGSGKSTFNRHLTRILWEEHQQSSTAPIPIFIALAEHTPSSEDLIESYLLEQKFLPEAITELRKEKRLVFILDGFDEIKDRTQAFYTQNKLDHWKNAQVIISSRPEYLGGNYRSQFQKRGQTSTLQEYWLSTISDDWIAAYIQKYIQHTQRTEWSLKRYQGALNNLPTLKEAIRRPFLLRMALDLLPDLAKNKSALLTRIALYDAFISRWWNRSEERLQHIKLTAEEKDARNKLGQHLATEGLKASQEMAIALTQNGLVQASYDLEKNEVVPEVWRTYLNKKDTEKRLLLFNAPLIHRGQHYRFIHKSIQDYCVARAICSPQFSDAQPCVDAVLNQFLLVDEALILDFLVERVNQHPVFKAHLHAWIEASKDPDAVVTVGAANAMTILVRAGVGFNGADLNRIRIPGADLSYGVFDSAQLKGSDLSGVNFRQVWLYQANLSGAQMVGVQFGEWPTLKEKSSVYSCVYSPDGKACAMVFGDGKVCVYDTSSWAKIHTLRGHTNSVWSVAYSPHGTQLASGSFDNTVRLWDVQSGESVRTLRGHTNFVSSVAYSPSGTQLASGSLDNTVRLWDVQSGESVRTLRGHTNSVWSVAYSPHGTQLASGSDDKTVRLWDVQSGESVRTLLGHTNSVWSV